MAGPQQIRVIDTHTGGEPTRIVISGGPELGSGPMAARRARFRDQFDELRSAIVNEPRGSDVMVGALLTEPVTPGCVTGVIFFNNVGYLGMCGHGTMGLAVALAHLGRIRPGVHRLDTPVGVVSFELSADGQVAVENVPSYRLIKSQTVEVPGLGPIVGDVAWGGNWFFLVNLQGQNLDPADVERLTDYAWRTRQALRRQRVTGTDAEEIDHVELFSHPRNPSAHSRNFVLCPGKAYDRSPCGTGTSAKLACLAADGKLAEGEIWRQESIVGSIFEGSFRRAGDRIIPRIRGSAFVNAEATLILDPNDPFRMGIRI